MAPAGVGGLASDATLQLCSVSATSGRSSCSLGESRKRPRADDDAGGNGENFEEDVPALIACTLEKHQASARERTITIRLIIRLIVQLIIRPILHYQL